MTLKESRKMYKEYIKEHKQNVTKAGILLCELGFVDEIIYPTFMNNIKKHDESKYSKEEFEPYRQYFYPADGEIGGEELFNQAWEHHKRNNLHHYEVWINAKLDMPAKTCYFLEMVADWIAMSMKFGDTAKEYYEKK